MTKEGSGINDPLQRQPDPPHHTEEPSSLLQPHSQSLAGPGPTGLAPSPTKSPLDSSVAHHVLETRPPDKKVGRGDWEARRSRAGPR